MVDYFSTLAKCTHDRLIISAVEVSRDSDVGFPDTAFRDTSPRPVCRLSISGVHERIRGKKRATCGNKSRVLRFLSPELRQSRRQTCRSAANSSFLVPRGWGRGRIDLRPLVSVIHHRDYFERRRCVRSHSKRAFSK